MFFKPLHFLNEFPINLLFKGTFLDINFKNPE